MHNFGFLSPLTTKLRSKDYLDTDCDSTAPYTLAKGTLKKSALPTIAMTNRYNAEIKEFEQMEQFCNSKINQKLRSRPNIKISSNSFS
jgi:hypothetical protein